jgi:hypothetical protein
MKQTLFFAFVLAFAIFSISCTSDVKDTTKPVIVLHEPAEGDTLFIGHDVHLDVELSDDIKLGSYKVDIHSNFDGHGHAVKPLFTKTATSADVAWSFSKSWDVSDKRNTDIHHHEITVPTTINGSPIAAGDYHFSVYVTDQAGNESKVIVGLVVGVGTPKAE